MNCRLILKLSATLLAVLMILTSCTGGRDQHPDTKTDRTSSSLSSSGASSASDHPITAPTPETKPLEIDDSTPAETLVQVSDYLPDIVVDLRYGGSDNLAGKAMYSFTDAYIRYGSLKKLAKVQEELRTSGLTLVIWDAFRPLDAQFALSRYLPSNATNPAKGTTPFNLGSALSVAVARADGSRVDLPSDFDGTGAASDRDFDDVSAEAAEMAGLLDRLMVENGFEHYLDKWYRYVDSDEYPLVTDQTLTADGLSDCRKWIVSCDESINFRSGPSTTATAIGKVERDTEVTVTFFYDKFAYVVLDGVQGYLSAAYLRPKEDGWSSVLKTVTPVENYSYDQMETDLRALADEFPDQLTLQSIGKSEEGRDLTLAVLGNPKGERKIFVSAAIHAREHMTATLSMAQIEYLLRSQSMEIDGQGKTVGAMLNECCFYVLPMTNPDGVMISQTGVIPEAFQSRYSAKYAPIWKANAKGIDLNGNFDADWDKYGGGHSVGKPSYMNYKGTAPECAAESKAVANFMRSTKLDLVLCYHATGTVIYWSYGDRQDVNDASHDLANLLASDSGFMLGTPSSTSTAGLKDYAIDVLGIPGLTIEVGSEACPLKLREFDGIFERCKDQLILSALWTMERE